MADQIRFLAGWMAVQAVPKLAEKVGLPLNLPAEHVIYGMSMDEIQKTLKDYEGILKNLMNEHNISWWDIYTNSDVGKERLALAEKMRIDEGDAVLDVGCGRGYLTIALATLCNTVCGLDLMNGFGRRDWWINFRAAMKVLGIDQKVTGERASAAEIPFRDGSFSLTVSAHALRNFGDRYTIIEALKEMRRVTRRKGRVVIAENLPIARRKAHEAHLKMFVCRTKYVRGDNPLFTEAKLLEMFREAKMSPTRMEIFDFDLSATPPIFVLNTASIPEEKREEAEREYSTAVEMIRRYGESSTPVLLLEALVE